MQSERLTDFGIVERRSFDSDGSLIVKRMQDVSPLLERNAYLRNHVDWRGDRDPNLPDMRLGASIPNMIIEEWLKKGINVYNRHHWPEVQKLLNGDYKYLKTFPGRI